MTLVEAIDVLVMAPGSFSEVHSPGPGRAKIKYTGTDAEDEGRVLAALLVVAEEVGLRMLGMETDDVYVPADFGPTGEE